MKKKFLLVLLAFVAALCLCFGLAACGESKDKDIAGGGDDSQTEQGGGNYEQGDDDLWTVERLYVEAQSKGFEGSLDDLIALFQGKDGKDGADGVGIKTIYINEQGELVVELTEGEPINLGVVCGRDGTDGQDGVDGTDGQDGIDGTDGIDGQNGVTPHIGEDGNWWIGEQDTGVKAEGKDGQDLTKCEHTFPSQWTVQISASCTSIGYSTRTCQTCGFVEYRFQEALGHGWENCEFIETEPTCEERGVRYDICNTCGTVKATVLDALGHEYKSRVCIRCGQKQPTEGLLFEKGYDYAYVTGVGNITDTEIVIPAEHDGLPVTSIGDGAFRDLRALQRVEIPNSVTSIGDNAFYDCRSLREVQMPEKMATISGGAFENCTSLTEITIPEGVTALGRETFAGCTALQKVTIPTTLRSCAYMVFDGCTALQGVYIFDLAAWFRIEFVNESYGNWCGNPLYYANNLYLKGALVETVEVPEEIDHIEDQAFRGANCIKEIKLHDGIVWIGDYAFYGCCFKEISLPNSIASIGDYAFTDCSALEKYIVGESNKIYSSKDGILYNKEQTEIIAIPRAIKGAVTIPNSVTEIGESAFLGCEGLTSVTLGSGVTEIGGYAFSGCSGLTSITIPDSVKTIGSSAFYNCSGLTSVTLGNGVTEIGGYTFYGCSGLMSIEIPDSVTEIGGYTFYGCSGLKSIVIPDGVTEIGGFTFDGCSGLTSIEIPDGVTSIGNYAFDGCSGLKDVHFKGTVKEWLAIEKGYNWNRNTGEYTVTCTDGTIAKDGTVTYS